MHGTPVSMWTHGPLQLFQNPRGVAIPRLETSGLGEKVRNMHMACVGVSHTPAVC